MIDWKGRGLGIILPNPHLWEFVGGQGGARRNERAGTHLRMLGGVGGHSGCGRGVHGCGSRIPGSYGSPDTVSCNHP